jgi:hypothetical protein
LTADGHVISIPPDTRLGDDYRIEIGLYYLPTMELVQVIGLDGSIIGNHTSLGPVSVGD